MADSMITAGNHRRTFQDLVAVAGISYSVQHGQIYGLLGPNGAGKTTTTRMLTGQIDPSGRSATVAGCDVARDRVQLKERIGVVFEEQDLYERLSARDNLRSVICLRAAVTRCLISSDCAGEPETPYGRSRMA
jgi:ABC-2 type transport system ATP-binding protein